MKSFLRISIFLQCLLATAQVEAQSTPQISYPQIIPPSPEAASLGKYGDIPVGMFTGHPNVSIDLDKITTRHLSLPISLNYNVNGIKVNELSSNVGMSWALNCGGVITRTIYGFPDFLSSHPYAFYPSTLSFSTTNPDAGTIAWMNTVATQGEDTQVDAFNFNFNGYSGKFFIIPQGPPGAVIYKIVTVPYSNVKIQYDLTRSDWNFIMTTPEGVQYYFGGVHATENIETTNDCGTAQPGLVPSAWYLTKIQYPNDPADSLSFSYITTNYQYSTGVNQVETYWDGTGTCPNGDQNVACSCGPTAYIYSYATAAMPQEQFCTTSTQVFVMYLQSITDSKYNQALFDYIPKVDANGGYLLSHITMKNYQTGQKLKVFGFNYQTASPITTIGNTTKANNVDASTGLPRPFLTEVDELDTNGIIVKPYKFGYNDFTHLPRRLCFAQDYWGYYNGITNNFFSFIPMPSSQAQLLVSSSLIANRNPDYNYASMGLLNKVTYPTGGYTTIEYEGNAENPAYTGATDPSNYVSAYSQVQNIEVTSSSPAQTFTVPATGSSLITAEIDCNCPGGTGCPTEADGTVWATLVANGTTTVQSFNFQAFNQRQDCSKATIVNVTLQPGTTYVINISPISPFQFSVSIQAPTGSYLNLPGLLVPGTGTLQSTAGGIRVKRVVSFDPIANISTIKHFYYDPLSTILPAQPTYYHHLTHKELFWQSDPTTGACNAEAEINWAGFHQFSSSSFIDAFGQNSSPIYYQKVTESIGDNYEDGGTEHDFSFNGFLPISTILNEPVYSASPPLLDWRNGLEQVTKHFKMVNGLQIPVSTKTMAYQVDSRNSSSYNQYVIEKCGNADASIPSIQIQNYNVAQINYISEWQYLTSDSVQNYDLAGNPTTSVKTNYYYDNPLHSQLTRTSTTDSRRDTLISKIKYPQDYIPNGNTLTGNTILDTMIGKNMISSAIEKQDSLYYKGSASGYLTGAQLSLYRIHVSGINTIIPDKTYKLDIQNPINNFQQFSFTGNNTSIDTRNRQMISFDQYDATNNLNQYTTTDQNPATYIWDYLNSYPIAQVKNAILSDVAATSFEADGYGNWNAFSGSISTVTVAPFPPTGNKYYNITPSATLSKSGLVNGNTYIISYWSKNGVYTINGGTAVGTYLTGKLINGWTYFEHKILATSTTLTITGSGAIDEVRLYPSNAQMTTYTYSPLIGVTTVCDADNKVTYYYYDAIERVKWIKDQDGNILKTFQYHYIGESTQF